MILSSETKNEEETVREVRELGEKYYDMYGGCAQATFAAVAEALDLKYRNDNLDALIGLSGGVGALGIGSCGAVIGAAAAISLSFGVSVEEIGSNKDLKWDIYNAVKKLGDKFTNKYNGLSCREVQIDLYGTSFDLRNDKARKKFKEMKECEKVVADAAVWGTEIATCIRNEKPGGDERK